MGFYYSQFLVTPSYPTQSFLGQTVIVTGANVGLGFEAARHFIRLQAATVILAVRNVVAGEEAKRKLELSTDRAGVCEVWELDLASYASVQAFARKAAAQLPRLDVLVSNAALATTTFSLAEGHERTITVNVTSTILLALLLLPKLRESATKHPDAPCPRLTFVVSETHAWTPFPEYKAANTFERLDDWSTADMGNRYASSKLMEILILREMADRTSDAEPQVVVNMVNPGLCHSGLAREFGWGFWVFKQLVARSTEVGSRTLLAGASAGAESHAKYMTDGKVDDGALSGFVRSPEGKTAQQKLWTELTTILEGIDSTIMQNL
ncbi:putative secondary metabolism biosynthetic enzyme [Aspergillus chevalieri]|uniref:Putative secondary metabolism biosynthetic enzyme n=1 Tax=Aspergillus chevalieri TaxID=182096 RepID=A0A7R7ZRM0_ASPCH|nr:putative secondary metabolism biosynthetic enzyme [Aspergillus chevalieri]BCR92225.1 putative secondary metabolism biosynthetic enzyme [Aspergillus chevalieri]